MTPSAFALICAFSSSVSSPEIPTPSGLSFPCPLLPGASFSDPLPLPSVLSVLSSPANFLALSAASFASLAALASPSLSPLLAASLALSAASWASLAASFAASASFWDPLPESAFSCALSAAFFASSADFCAPSAVLSFASDCFPPCDEPSLPFLGFLFGSTRHISIFAYYVFLLLIKGILVFGITNKKAKSNQLRIVYTTFIILIVMTIAMIAPAFLLLLDKRTYNLGLIPSIASAAYTTYSITMSIVNMKKAKNSDGPIIKQIRLVNIVNTLMSILVLQNTLILANGGYTDDMKKLSMATSIGIIVLIIFIEIYQFILVKSNHGVSKKW